ncbi:MAG: helix-turn-helix domain-containing protein [Candidatus Promineifilaceae bacterium]
MKLCAADATVLYDSSMAEEWLTTEEAAEFSGYHVIRLRRLTRAGKLYGRKFSPVWQVIRQSLVEYIEAARESGDKKWGPKHQQNTKKPYLISINSDTYLALRTAHASVPAPT